ncbi:hypothetical protein CHU93_08685 [Sandarakinorhabdus cyanobacteriorum]|uniref:Outer membrane protein beta-barrel domain-containing protein n=1 Tax=Sandarakinorhabdus cyanobacteriorum TaxID=1981098 RepID=A0A255YHU2_9SPHN|nr:outer membrane beta-barrel protein [Sandarakinorhabdus cyanobacteriorum]OYQ28761.1 hypothetical protein CHU93_08685 [Sandarakinorhabdus cyanobacteriorum]
MRAATLTHALAWVLAIVAAPALAQVARPGQASTPVLPTVADSDDLDGTSSSVAGLPGYPGRGFNLQAMVSTRYEDNLSRRPVKDDGVRIRPKATLSYGLGAGRIGLYAIGTYGRDIVRGNNLFAGADRHFYGGGAAMQLSRCNIDGGGSFKQNLVFTSDVALAGSFEQRTSQFGAAVSCQIGSALSVNGGISQATMGVVRRVTQALDSNRWTYNAGLALERPAFGRLSLDGSISDINLTGRQVLTPDGLVDDGLLQRSLRLGYSRNFGSRITLTLGGSYLDTAPKATQNVVIVDGLPQVVDRSSFNGAGYDAGLVVRLSPRLGLTGSASRNIRSNGFVGAQFIVVDTVEGGISYELPNGMTLAAGYNYRDSRFRGAVITSLEARLRNRDRFYRYFAHLGGKLGRRINLALDVSHNQRRSDPSVFNFDSTAVGFTLGFELGNQGS